MSFKTDLTNTVKLISNILSSHDHSEKATAEAYLEADEITIKFINKYPKYKIDMVEIKRQISHASVALMMNDMDEYEYILEIIEINVKRNADWTEQKSEKFDRLLLKAVNSVAQAFLNNQNISEDDFNKIVNDNAEKVIKKMPKEQFHPTELKKAIKIGCFSVLQEQEISTSSTSH